MDEKKPSMEHRVKAVNRESSITKRIGQGARCKSWKSQTGNSQPQIVNHQSVLSLCVEIIRVFHSLTIHANCGETCSFVKFREVVSGDEEDVIG
jgi:hypothetical protein